MVTLGDKGSLLLKENGEVIKQPCFPVDKVVDETGAGDNYRAAFCVAHFIEKKSLEESMKFAASAGAVAVSKLGAIPSCATREECNKILGLSGGHSDGLNAETFPFKFASRLNSMKDRADLALPGETNSG